MVKKTVGTNPKVIYDDFGEVGRLYRQIYASKVLKHHASSLLTDISDYVVEEVLKLRPVTRSALTSKYGIDPKTLGFESVSKAPDAIIIDDDGGELSTTEQAIGAQLAVTEGVTGDLKGRAIRYLEVKQEAGTTGVTTLAQRTPDIESRSEIINYLRKTKQIDNHTTYEQLGSANIKSFLSGSSSKTAMDMKAALRTSISQKINNTLIINYKDYLSKQAKGAQFYVLTNVAANIKIPEDLIIDKQATSKSGKGDLTRIQFKLSDKKLKELAEKTNAKMMSISQKWPTVTFSKFKRWYEAKLKGPYREAPQHVAALLAFVKVFEPGGQTPFGSLLLAGPGRRSRTISITTPTTKGDRRAQKRGRFISNVQLSAILQKRIAEKMPRYPEPKKPTPRYITGNLARSFRLMVDYRKGMMKYYNTPRASGYVDVLNQGGWELDETLVEPTIRQIAQQLFGRQFRVLRTQ